MNQWDKDFRDWILAISKELTVTKKKGARKSVLHIGGHVGQEANFYLKRGFDVTYCEPVPEFAQRIKALDVRVELDGRLNVLQVAVGKEGILDFHVHGQESTYLEREGTDKWDTMKVVSVPLWLLQARDVWDLLVIDAQGATMDILNSGDPTAFRFIICEASENPPHQGEADKSDVVEFMGSKGFILLDWIQHGKKDIFDLIFKNTRYDFKKD